MKFAPLLTWAMLLFSRSLFGAEPPRLSLHNSGTGVELAWPGTFVRPDGFKATPYFEVQRSADLLHWQPYGERMRAGTGGQDELLRVALQPGEPYSFHRLLQVEPSGVSALALNGAEIFGYSAAFAAESARVGQISPEEFEALFPSGAEYLPGVSWDPTTAQFWNEFNANPAVINEGKEGWDSPGYRIADYRLEPNEMIVLKKNGFVVSQRLGADSFGEAFYDLWHADLPVFISCDALLQAWHRTYDAILEEVEETYLFNSAENLLADMAARLPLAASEVGNGALKESLLDADYFLTVARSLLTGTNAPAPHSLLGQDDRVAATVADVRKEELKLVDDFMGFCRVVDFSQFKVRGHYTHTERLARYFQCMIWLGRIDIPVAGGPWKRCPGLERLASPRELGMAIVLWHLLNTSGGFQNWADMDRTISVFVGVTDSLNFGQLGGILAGAGIRSLVDVRDTDTLIRLQASISQGVLGVQNIRSDWFEQPLGGAARYALPQTFTVFGQKFVPDSWAFSQTVFSSILWVQNGVTNKVQRRVPGALDVAFSVLGNDQVVPELISQMQGKSLDRDRPHAGKFRDGLPYQHNLTAVRRVMDQQTPAGWESNIYMGWLSMLRQLSRPTTAATYPEAMRTRAWAMKTVNTQLASWTQLRHDTILYAKQSYTGFGQCVYPIGFVEPRSDFWEHLEQLSSKAAAQIASLTYKGQYAVVSPQLDPRFLEPVRDPATDELLLQTNLWELTAIQQRQTAHLRAFSETAARLQALTARELTGECFTPAEELFIDGLMEGHHQGLACGGTNVFSGWYPRLFYRTVYWTDFRQFHAIYGAGGGDALVADVHTDVPDDQVGDPGSVLHEGVGRVNLLMMVVDRGAERFVCAGPVLSHYEFEVTGEPRRISDIEWSESDGFRGEAFLSGEFPSDLSTNRFEGLAPPAWTQTYLIPSAR